MQIYKWTESKGSHLKEDIMTDQRGVAKHLLKSEGGDFKRGGKKILKMGCLRPLLCKIRSLCRSDILL